MHCSECADGPRCLKKKVIKRAVRHFTPAKDHTCERGTMATTMGACKARLPVITASFLASLNKAVYQKPGSMVCVPETPQGPEDVMGDPIC